MLVNARRYARRSIEKMPCKSADGPTWAARSKDPNLGADECKTTDPLLTLSTGVCVRAFNKKGRRAIQELRKEAKRAYASSFAEAPDVAAGHTDESRTDDDANPTQMDFYPDAIVSLERLEVRRSARSERDELEIRQLRESR